MLTGSHVNGQPHLLHHINTIKNTIQYKTYNAPYVTKMLIIINHYHTWGGRRLYLVIDADSN